MTEEDQDYLRTENRTGDYINDVLRDLPDDFQTYVKRKKLHCRHWIYIPLGNYGLYVGRVFWSREDEQCERHPAPCSQLIDSIANPEIIEKIKSLLRKLELPGNILVQFWKAVESGGRRLLTTRDQPFCLAASKFLPLPYMTYERLCSHRLISLDYDFFLDGGESEEEDQLGLPGRVFLNQQLESTPNVSYYSSKEYPPRDRTNTSSCLALPVFEPSGRCCVGVLEIVNDDSFYTPKHKYEICRALEDVGLKCLETCNHLYGQNKDKVKALEGALVEIRKGLKVVCETHDLPLAQIWVWCRLCNAAFYYCSFNSSAYVEYQREIHMNYFIEACNLHPLRKGEGVVGKAFLSRNLVFCKDITQFRITEYRLAHYSRKYGLNGCLAICLRSSDIGDDLYVIEFFLPPSNMKGGDPRTTMAPIFATMRQHFQSFKVASGEELGEELSIEVIGFSKDDRLDSFLKPQTTRSPDRPKTLENGGETVLLDSSDQQFIVADAGNNVVGTAENSDIAITSSQQKCIIKLSRRKHRNAGIQISLEDVQKQSGKKLDDAAESLGGKLTHLGKIVA